MNIGRMRKRKEFLAAAASRRKWAASGLIMQVREHNEADRAANPDTDVRLGFTASKKVGNSVARNRARRRLREAARAVVPAHAASGCDIVLIARTETLTRPFTDLKQDILTGLTRLKACRPEDVAIQGEK